MSRYTNSAYKISRVLSGIIPLKSLISNTNVAFLPFWHTVSNEPLPHIFEMYKMQSIEEFKTSLEFILKHFHPVSLEELYKGIPSNLSKPVVHFSFDDGLKECAEIIAPILYEKGIPATFFINSAFVDNKDLFYRYKQSLIYSAYLQSDKTAKANAEYKSFVFNYSQNSVEALNKLANSIGFSFEDFLGNVKPYMTLQQLLELERKEFTIGGHSHDHSLFSDLNLDEQIEQVDKCMSFIDLNFNQKMKAFAFPFTDNGVNSELFTKLNEKQLVEISFGTAGLKKDRIEKHFQRVPMEGFPSGIKSLVKSEYLNFYIKKLLGKETVQRG